MLELVREERDFENVNADSTTLVTFKRADNLRRTASQWQ